MSNCSKRILSAILALSMATLHSGCRTPSIADEKAIGAEAQRVVRQQESLFRDAVTVHYVRTLGEELMRHARPTPFTVRFYVLENDQLNAAAYPSCKLYVNTGLILAVDNTAQLASVIAHEIGHCTARHFAKRYPKMRAASFFSYVFTILAGILTGSQIGVDAGAILGGIVGQAVVSAYTRDYEAEADQLGLEIMIKSGWDPREMQSMFELLQRTYGTGGGTPAFLRTHPTSPERIAAIGKEIEGMDFADNLRIEDGGRLQIIQKRIDLLLGTDVLDAEDDEFEDDEELEDEDEEEFEDEDDAGDDEE